MAQMTDPFAALISFQAALKGGALSLQPGDIDPKVFVHLDQPNGSTRFTYVRFYNRTVVSLAMLVQVQPLEGLPCFQLGYAVPERYRAQGRAKDIAASAVAELERGLTRNGVRTFCIEAIVGTDNEPSMRVATATVSNSPVPITDELSGLPAFHYIRKFEEGSTR